MPVVLVVEVLEWWLRWGVMWRVEVKMRVIVIDACGVCGWDGGVISVDLQHFAFAALRNSACLGALGWGKGEARGVCVRQGRWGGKASSRRERGCVKG